MKHKCKIYKASENTWVTKCLDKEAHFNSLIRIDHNWLNCVFAGIHHYIQNYDDNSSVPHEPGPGCTEECV